MVEYLVVRYRQWLSAPVENAAGTIGIFRILYAFFYLWRIADRDFRVLAAIPPAEWQPISFLSFDALFFLPTLPVMNIAQLSLVGGLAALLVGYGVPIATLVVLVSGLYLDTVVFSYGKVDHSSMFLTFYIPFLMLFSRWGATYSLDAIRRGGTVLVESASWQYIWPRRGVLVMLCVLFFSAGWHKVFSGEWLQTFDILKGILQYRLLYAYQGSPPADEVAIIVQAITRLPWVYIPAQIGVVLFELLFPLALVHRGLRRMFLWLAILFHMLNRVFLGITFTPLIIAYAIFVDWQWFVRQLRLPTVHWRRYISVRAAHVIGVGVVLGHVVTWNALFSVRALYDGLGVPGHLWIPMGILAIVQLIWMGIGAAYAAREWIRAVFLRLMTSKPVPRSPKPTALSRPGGDLVDDLISH